MGNKASISISELWDDELKPLKNPNENKVKAHSDESKKQLEQFLLDMSTIPKIDKVADVFSNPDENKVEAHKEKQSEQFLWDMNTPEKPCFILSAEVLRPEALKGSEFLDLKKSLEQAQDLPIDLKEILKDSQWQYGIVFPIFSVAKRPIIRTDIAVTKCFFPRNYSAIFDKQWVKSSEEIQQLKMGYTKALFEAKAPTLNANVSDGIEIKRKTTKKKELNFLYVEELIPKGGLDLNIVDLRSQLTDDFRNFLAGEINIEQVKMFFNTFGHVFPTRIIYGGKRYVVDSYTSEQIKKVNQSKIEGNILADLGAPVSGKVDAGVGGIFKTQDNGAKNKKSLLINTVGGSPEDSQSKDKWLESVAANPKSWAVIKVEQYERTFDLLDEETRVRVQACLTAERAKNFIQSQHKTPAHFPWRKKIVKARRFEGRCPGSYFVDGCLPIPHRWICPRCQEYIYIDDDKHLYCGCFIYKKRKIQFYCSNPTHSIPQKKYCRKSIKHFVKSLPTDAPYHAIFAKTGDKYIGELYRDKLHGKGSFFWKEGARYEGEFVEGKRTGYGKFFYGSGKAHYEGKFEEGRFSGEGKFWYDNGDWYEGEFQKGKPNGNGTYFWISSGDSYTGNFARNECTGKGKYLWANKDTYEGEFTEDRLTGYGKYLWNDSGVSYEGDLEDGKPHGKGRLFVGGQNFEGYFIDGKVSGRGTYRDDKGNRFEGEFLDGKFKDTCKARLDFDNGDRYEGLTANNRFNGIGKYIFANRDQYQGKFVQGKKYGEGKYSFANGYRYEGHFVNDRLSGHGTFFSPNERHSHGRSFNNRFHEKGKFNSPDGSLSEGHGPMSTHGEDIRHSAKKSRNKEFPAQRKINGEKKLSFPSDTRHSGRQDPCLRGENFAYK